VVVELAKVLIGMAVILGAWLAVQMAWRRVFPGTPADEDVLAGRFGCHGCSRETECGTTREDGGTTTAERPD
jgi:hypothetical protein